MEYINSSKSNSLDRSLDNLLENEEDTFDLKSMYGCSRKAGKWSQEEDNLLIKLIEEYGNKSWKHISKNLTNKSPVQCLHRWTKILKPGLTKGPWSIEEDRKLLEWKRSGGPLKWSLCSEFISGRSGKQCRERWFNTLNPNVKKGDWSPEEDYTIFQSFSILGSKWSNIAKNLPGRTENSIKNRFYSTLRRISTENSKLKSESNFIASESIINVTNNNSTLVELLNYFPQALEEKSKLFTNTKETDNMDNYLDKSNIPTKKNKYINKKTSRSFKTPQSSTNINNTYNLNVNINKKLIDGLKPTNTNKNLEELENTINDWCEEDYSLKDKVFENLEMKINKIIHRESHEKNLNLNTQNYLSNLSFKDNYNMPNYKNISLGNRNLKDDDILSLLSKLNDLEKILQVTKNELFQNYENNKNCNTGNIENNGYQNYQESQFQGIYQNSIQTANENSINIWDNLNLQNSQANIVNEFMQNFNNPFDKNNNNLQSIALPNVTDTIDNNSVVIDELSPDKNNGLIFDHMFKF